MMPVTISPYYHKWYVFFFFVLLPTTGAIDKTPIPTEPALIPSDKSAPCQNSDAPHKNTTDNC